MNKKILLFAVAMTAFMPAIGQTTAPESATIQPAGNVCPLGNQSACDMPSCSFRHPWAGKRVCFIGDSMTDPRNILPPKAFAALVAIRMGRNVNAVLENIWKI